MFKVYCRSKAHRQWKPYSQPFINKENAEKFINFLCDPENAEQNVEYIGYSTPNTAAYDLLPEDIRDNKVAYPDKESLKNCEVFIDLPSKILRKYDEAWLEIKCVY